ncbi:hypothetical protein JW930_03465 [Candidatus Woesearchaeota archaeon]|nr:hypothetical protein [Candidatus Woesearchaeota archaeon]
MSTDYQRERERALFITNTGNGFALTERTPRLRVLYKTRPEGTEEVSQHILRSLRRA